MNHFLLLPSFSLPAGGMLLQDTINHLQGDLRRDVDGSLLP